MPRRRLGRSQLVVSALGLGCMGMSEFYGPSEERSNLDVLERARDLGVNFLDTADMYGVGRNEQLISQVLRKRRHETVLATKFGFLRAEDGSMLGLSGRPQYVRRACEASLRRLRVDHIDLYYLHRVDPSVPIEETVGAMSRLIEAGMVRYLGLSEVSASSLRRASTVYPITALQSEYSLWTRDVEAEILPVCRELGTSLVACSPLGRGFLSGSIGKPEDLDPQDWRRSNPRFEAENLRRNLALVEALSEMARAKQCTPAQLALAWLLRQASDVLPIPGTRHGQRLEENLAATQIMLSADDIGALKQLPMQHPIHGDRYSSECMALLNA
ncbi:MAG: aldo/keto reductase [Panacagrimonas sp.]